MKNEQLARLESRKPLHLKALEETVIWLAMALGIACPFIASVIILPILVVLTAPASYFFVGVIGLLMGLMFEIICRNIDKIERKHHIIVMMIIPFVTVLNFSFMYSSIRYYPRMLGIDSTYDPIIIGLVFCIAFLVPYIIYQFVLKKNIKH